MRREFVSPRVIFGPGGLDCLATLPARPTAIVTDDGVMERLGVLKRASGYLSRGGSPAYIAGRIGREPHLADITPVVAALRERAPGRIVALGGGSVIDAAKAAWAFYEHQGLDWETALRFDGLPQTAPQTDLVAIPTTSGTGSEVSGVAVLIDDDTRLKRLIMSPGIVPTLAVVDPDLPASMPPTLTAHSALDALTHAVEARVTTIDNEFSTALALRALSLIFAHLPAAHCEGQARAREALHLAATLAGLAATNSTAGLAHALDQVGPLFDVPHGLVCAVLLPYTVAFNLEAAAEAYAEMAAVLDVRASGTLEQARGFVRRLLKLECAVGLPLSFAAAGVGRERYWRHLDRLVAAAVASRSSQLSPRPPSAVEAEAIFLQAYEGSLPEWTLI